ncbi:hypothetical protein K7X08_036818 [Anisodus acutangulus]|uniref:FKBP12-rapamycin binding domain-containing protein n=1 Tax=Anisodus acutangulus TaxID=402998 RepID=A0A9Q1L9N0_9SOLA|nr:hypothetical protein K7X08_036818 [Anisodus acutangulus]
MAVSSNRSPSPVTARPIPPNPTARRSFNGNPFSRPLVLATHRGINPVTPFNSPADSAKRVFNSGKEGLSYDDKENELKAAKLRSPAKGSKNFMSPTISASSKIAQSPKKKILVERNDPVRTSITLSDGKATFFSEENVKSLEGTENVMEPREETVPVVEGLPPPVTKPQKKVTFLEVPSNYNNDLSDTVTMDSELCNDEPLVIAPLDADPSLPPYDPRTNYLSPRPQFLHYKPNPRIEVLLNKEKGLDVGEPKRLDDIFLSELLSDNFSDIDGSESSLTEDSLKESDGSSSEEAIVDQEDEEEPKVSEPEIPVAEKISEAKMRTKPSSSTISKKNSLLLVLVIGLVSISATDSPILATPVSIVSNLNIPSDIPVLAKANSYFKQFSGEAISYFSKLIYDVGRVDYPQPLKFVNLTDLEESSSICHRYLKGSISSEELDKELEPIELEEDEESETEPDEEEFQMEADLDDINEVETEGAHELEIEEVSAIQLAEVVNEADSLEKDGQHDLEIEEAFAIQLAEVNEADSLEKDLDQGQHDLVETEEVSVVLAEGNESDSSERDLDQGLATSNVQLELAESKSSIADTAAISSDASLESVKDYPESLVKDDSAVEEAQPLEMLKSPIDRHGDNVGAYQILGISSLVLGVLAATVLYVKRRNDETMHPVAVHADQVPSKKFEKHSSQNWPTEVDVAGESCPSEMSSFQISSSYSKKYPKSENDEAQSIEKKPRKSNRRESLATSEFSMGSPSYGSFTTYERIPIKHASGGGEEVITPSVKHGYHRIQDGAALTLRRLVEEEAHDLSGEAFARFMDHLYERITTFLDSNEVSENLGALRAIDELIDVTISENASKVAKFSNYMRAAFETKCDPEILVLASKVLGHLVGSGGAMTADEVERQVKVALECLRGERIEYHRFAAVLILKEMAENASTVFNVHVPEFVDAIWVALRDPTLAVREKAVEALRACLRVIEKRETRWRVHRGAAKELAMDLSRTATLQPVMQNALVVSSGVPLVARIYLRLGTWKWALSPGLDDDSIQEFLVHLEMLLTVQRTCGAHAKGVDDSLQDILRLLTLWFNHGATSEVQMALQKGFTHVNITTWLVVLPQIIARIHSNNHAVGELIQSLLVRIGQSSTGSYVTTSCGMQHSGVLVDQAQLVSKELIRVAILWHEMWHEALEEASRLYFGEHNIEGMLKVLEPLHEMLEEGASIHPGIPS